MRTPDEWRAISATITAGYTPSGKKELSYDTGKLIVDLVLAPWGIDRGDILDVGCGNARFGMALADNPAVTSYVGMDVNLPCMLWCRSAFAPYKHFRFEHLDVHNGRYFGTGKVSPDQATFPLKDASFDVIIANSLFTHISPRAAVMRYLSEMHRVLRPDGRLYSSWLRCPPHEVSTEEARTVYLETDIREMLKLSSFQLIDDRDIRRIDPQWRTLAGRV